MGHMASSIMVSTGRMEKTWSKMEGPWIFPVGWVVDTGTIIVLFLTCIMIIVVIILIEGMTKDIF